jgi:SecD/SecF fusion protein
MPDRDPTLDMLRELRDAGVSPPDTQVLHERVSSAIAEEIEREQHPRRGGLNGSSPGRATAERLRGAHLRLRFARRAGGLVPVVGVLAVALVVALFFGLHGSGPSSTAPTRGSAAPSHGGVELAYLAEPSAQAPVVTRGALERTVQVIRARLRALGIGGAHVSVSSANEIAVALPNVRNTARAEREIGTTAQLSFYDWEANALTPNGKTVASQLLVQDPTAMQISQGSGPESPGSPGAGSMPLYQAVQLASKQRYRASPANSRVGSQYWLFGAPGSAACAVAARDQGAVPFAGQHCLLSGPDANPDDLKAGLPQGVNASEGQTLTVPRGTVVLQAIPASFANPVPISDPSAQFYVLKDNVALGSSEITSPQQATDHNTRMPVVTFAFSPTGKTEFQSLTAQIARRGELASGAGQSLNQHFAVALDNQLITVPFIDYKQYPNGINGESGADISGSFTTAAAQDLANELRLGALPLNLKLICDGAPATTPCHRPRVR